MTYIIAARRTIVAPRGGALAGFNLHQLAVPVINAALADAGLAPADVDEVICGNALGAGGNPARVIALAAGIDAAGLTIDRQCCSGLDAILIAADTIRAGRANVVIAGGAESYSQRPYRARIEPDGALTPYDQPPFTPWPDRDPLMAKAADDLAGHLQITRAAQDEWAILSHQKALASNHPEIVQITAETRDPFARNLTQKTCARAAQISGDITQANTAVAADGAAFAVVVSETFLRSGALRIVQGATLGADPTLPGLAPIRAIQKILHADPAPTRAEIMEAFAAQAISCVTQTGLDARSVNVGGGALARGHPIGASGAVLVARLFHDLKPQQTGLAAIAAAGGIGTAALFEKL